MRVTKTHLQASSIFCLPVQSNSQRKQGRIVKARSFLLQTQLQPAVLTLSHCSRVALRPALSLLRTFHLPKGTFLAIFLQTMARAALIQLRRICA